MIEQPVKRHIVVFSPFYPPSIGGLQNHASEFNHQLAQHDYHITVFTPQIPIAAPLVEAPELNVSIIRFPAFEIIPNYPVPMFWQPLFWHQWRQIKPHKPGIVISRTRFFLTSLLAWFWTKYHHQSWVHIEHGSDYVQLSQGWQNMIGRIYDHTVGYLIFKQANALVANSQMTAAFIKKIYPAAQPLVIYRGVASELIQQLTADSSVRDRWGETVIIAYIGRLISGKGLDDLLQAFASVTDTTSKLLIIGGGPAETHLIKLAEQLHIQNRIKFTGSLTQPEAIRLLKSSDIVVNPSYTEGLPTAVIEAAICEKAIVATSVGGTAEIITDTVSGYLVPPRQPAVLTSLLNQLIADPALRQCLGKQAAAAVTSKFQWATTIRHYVTLFEQLYATRT